MNWVINLLLLITCTTVVTFTAANKNEFSEYGRVCHPDQNGTSTTTTVGSFGCNSAKRLHCHPQRRTCQCEEFPHPGSVYTWDKHVQRCEAIRTDLLQRHKKCDRLHLRKNGTHEDNKLICDLDVECQASKHGRLSKCNLDTCACECIKTTSRHYYDILQRKWYYNERLVTEKDGVCQAVLLQLGEECSTHMECSPIDRSAVCALYKYGRSCQCNQTSHVQVGSKCVPQIISLGTELCAHDEQCKKLDLQSICDPSTKVCICTNESVIYMNRCGRTWNQSCTVDEECQRGPLGIGAWCFFNTCECDEQDYIFDNGTCVKLKSVQTINTSVISAGAVELPPQTSQMTQVPEPDITKPGTESTTLDLHQYCNQTSHVQVGANCIPKIVFKGLATDPSTTNVAFTKGPAEESVIVKTVIQPELENEPMMVTVQSESELEYSPASNAPGIDSSGPSEPGAEGGKLDWVTPTAIISTIFFVIILITSAFLAYSKWKRIKLVPDLEFVSHGQANGTETLPLREIEGQGGGPGWEVSEEDFEVDPEGLLGSGRNGVVYRGRFKERDSGNSVQVDVAVKTNRENDLMASQIYLRAILEEAKTLIHLGHHPNVVQFYGVCQATINRGNVYLLCELCPLGSLEVFLRTNRNRGVFKFCQQRRGSGSDSGSEDPSDNLLSMSLADSPSKLGFGHLYLWAHQIASAMEFVSARKVIHSDLATRNVLLASSDSIRLTDFGLSRRLYDDYTYMKTNPDPLPWKWLDYDALRFMIFTTHTDVWSFGITLWEIWTLGEVPYPGIVTPQCQNFMGKLLEGFHPPKPEYATEEMYDLMVKCWKPCKMERPSFGELKEQLEAQGKMAGEKETLNGHGYLIPVSSNHS